MFAVRDVRSTVRWYQSIGFTLDDEYKDSGELVFAIHAPGGNWTA